MKWIGHFADEHYQKPIPKGKIKVELDEMHHFIQSKKTSCGFGRHIVAKLDNLLIGNLEIEVRKPLNGCIID